MHYCLATPDGIKALAANGIKGLLGLFGDDDAPVTSYSLDEEKAKMLRDGGIYNDGEMSYAGIDIVLNCYSREENAEKLMCLLRRKNIKVMIHEQFFYEDYPYYQADFREKLRDVFKMLVSEGYNSVFFEKMIG